MRAVGLPRLVFRAVPTAKRQRQKEGRRARLEAQRKVVQRKRLARRTAIIVVVAAAVVGSVFLITRGSNSPPLTAQQKANLLAKDAGCPSTPASATKPANTLHWAKPPKMTLHRTKTYVATITTTQGTMSVRLNVKGAPVNVNNFVFLALHHYYNCNTFGRVIPGFMDQTGDPTGTTEGSPGYVVPTNEFPAAVTKPRAVQYPKGTLAMANGCKQTLAPAACPPTNGAQFFIVAGASGETLPPKYTVIGRVTSGLVAVERINATGNAGVQTNGLPDLPRVVNRILSVTVSAL
jgi:cyclophilin family peptidyl-prolyl cis-trans isomerase